MYNSPWNSGEFCFQGVEVAVHKISWAITSHIHNILSNLLSEHKILVMLFHWSLFLTYSQAVLITDISLQFSSKGLTETSNITPSLDTYCILKIGINIYPLHTATMEAEAHLIENSCNVFLQQSTVQERNISPRRQQCWTQQSRCCAEEEK
jgi:hypothetical protein